jgi:phosphate transport system substrate-binding protein
MNNKTFNIFVGLSIVCTLLLSCGNKDKRNARTDTYSSGAISFASDESFSPIINEQIAVFQAMYPQAKVTPIYTNEIDGINMLMNGKVMLMFTSREFKPSELKNLRNRKFIPRSIPFAFDGLALVVNKSNPDTCISIQDIKTILSGKQSKWSKVFPKSKMGDIEVVFDNSKSSTVHYCVDSLLGGKPINSPNIYAVKKSSEVINFVEKHPNSIGIIGSNWLNDKRDTTNVTFKRNIRVMSVSKLHPATPGNSFKPYQYYIYNGMYPLIRTLYALLNDPNNGLPWGFAHFVESPKGQLIIFKSGLLPRRGDMTVREVNVSE